MAYGDIYVISSSRTEIYRYNGSSWGDSVIDLPAATASVSALAADPVQGGLIIVATPGNQNVVLHRYNGTSWDTGTVLGTRTSTGIGSKVSGLAVDPDNGDVLILSEDADKIFRYNGMSLDTGTDIDSSINTPRGIAVDSDGDIIIADVRSSAKDRVWRYDGTTWTHVSLPSNTRVGTISGVTVDEDDNILALAQFNTASPRSFGIWTHDGSAWDSTALIVKDEDDNSLTSSLHGVTVDLYAPPTVSIQTPSQEVNSGATVALMATVTPSAGSLSDLTITWTASDGHGQFVDASMPTTNWQAPSVNVITTVTLTLSAVHPGGASASASITITVNPAPVTPPGDIIPPAGPVVITPEKTTISEGEDLQLIGSLMLQDDRAPQEFRNQPASDNLLLFVEGNSNFIVSALDDTTWVIYDQNAVPIDIFTWEDYGAVDYTQAVGRARLRGYTPDLSLYNGQDITIAVYDGDPYS